MKKKNIIFGFTVLAASLINAQSQDTVRIHDTIREKQTVTTVVQQPPAAPEKPKLRRGEIGVRFMPTFTSLALNTYSGTTVQGSVTMS